MVSGEARVPPTPPLPVPYILERQPLPGASQPKGGPRFALLSPPRVGHSPGGASQLGPQKECSPCSPGQVGVLAGGGHVGTSRLRSVSVEPLQNTKLGTPGAPQPGALAPPPPHPGQPSWVGGLEGGILGSLDPDTEPHPSPSTRAPTGHLHAWRWGTSPPPRPHPGLGQSHGPGQGLHLPHLLPARPRTHRTPRPGQPPPTSRNQTFLPDQPKGLGEPT